MEVTIGVSNRHVHMTKEHLEILFGKDFELENIKNLNQPTQFSSSSKVTIIGPKGQIEGVRVLGGVRSYTQVEVSKTDAFKLGVNPPVRESGEIEGSEPITIVGPKGEIKLNEGCIIASRHIHITPKQVEMYGLSGINFVDVLVGGIKGGILTNVSVKVSELSYFELHLDTDDANAHLIKDGELGKIILK